MGDLGIFGPPPPAPPARYAARPDHREWEVLEDLAIWPVIAPRGSRADYDGACVWLCESLCRVPKCKPDETTHESVALVEMRTVTRHLSSPPDRLVELARRLLSDFRVGCPLSWAERCKILPSYIRKEDNQRSRISVRDLCWLLGRGAFDVPLIEDYLERLESGGVDLSDSSCDWQPDRRLLQRAVGSDSPLLWSTFVMSCRPEDL